MQVRAMSRVSARPKSKSTNPDSNCVSVALWWNQHLAPGTGRLPRGEIGINVWLHVHHFAGTESLFTGPKPLRRCTVPSGRLPAAPVGATSRAMPQVPQLG